MNLEHNPSGSVRMKLRDHPSMTLKSGMKEWPPLWVDVRGPAYPKPRGEVGYLRRVDQHLDFPTAVFLWIEHDESRYVGMMYFDDPTFPRELCRTLEAYVGVAIRKIGDLDLSYML